MFVEKNSFENFVGQTKFLNAFFSTKKFCTFIKISLKFVANVLIHNKSLD